MESIWHRPLTRKFWIPVGVVLLAAFAIALIYPFFVSGIEWSRQRSFNYRGEKIDLPFGWVYDKNKLPVTFIKPKSFIQNGGLDSDIFLDRIGASAENRPGIFTRWDANHPSSHFMKTVIPVTSDPGKRTLLCSQEELSSGLEQLHCIADDASWLFLYFGSKSDLDDAKTIMRNVLVHDAVGDNLRSPKIN
jgi:hypothetical protein